MVRRSDANDWDRWQPEEALDTRREQPLTVAEAKAADRAKRERYIANRKREAEQHTAQIDSRVRQLVACR